MKRVTVVLVTSTLALVPALPASAASVVITPTSAIGLVHAANDGSAAVDVIVCANFDQPVSFIEARVYFPGPRLGVAILGPTGGPVTSWCGTKADLRAGPPGNVTMDIS